MAKQLWFAVLLSTTFAQSSQIGLTALEFAVEHGNRKAVRMLVKHGSDVRQLIEVCSCN